MADPATASLERTGEEVRMDNTIEQSAMRKIYIRLLPFAILSYFLAYVDRINISFAALTMRDDLQMSATAYGFALGTFIGPISFLRSPATWSWRKSGRDCGSLVS